MDSKKFDREYAQAVARLEREKAAKQNEVEAYGVQGLQSKPWRKTFRSLEALSAWAERSDAEIHGVRNTAND